MTDYLNIYMTSTSRNNIDLVSIVSGSQPSKVDILHLLRHQIKTVAEALVRRDSQDQSGSVKDGREKFNFRDYLSYKFYGHPFNGTWISDKEVMYQNQVSCLPNTDI